MGYADETWREQASCRGEDLNLFFLEPGAYTKAKREQVQRICNGCSVRGECLSWAIDNDVRHGVFGGMTPRQRTYIVWEKRQKHLARQGRNIFDYP
jgi:WhiB family redox-sensing transcriptional regulator